MLSLPADGQSTALTRPADIESPTAFTQVLAEVHSLPEHKYSRSHMPPRFPSKPTKHILKLQEGSIPHGEHDYFPWYVWSRAQAHTAKTTPRCKQVALSLIHI